MKTIFIFILTETWLCSIMGSVGVPARLETSGIEEHGSGFKEKGMCC